MMALALFTALFVANVGFPIVTTIEYRHLPAEVVSGAVYEWNGAAPSVRVSSAAVRDDRAFLATESPGARVVVVFTRRDGAYLADGPFVWPSQNATRNPDPVWRRTAAGAGPPGNIDGSPPIWITADQNESWPQCRWSASSRWECWGIPMGGSGVLVQTGAAKIWWCAFRRSGPSPWFSAHWGRLLVAAAPDGAAPRDLQLRAERAVPPPAYRFKDIRLETKPVPSVSIVQLSTGAVWIAGADNLEQAWVTIRASDAAPRFVSLADLANGS